MINRKARTAEDMDAIIAAARARKASKEAYGDSRGDARGDAPPPRRRPPEARTPPPLPASEPEVMRQPGAQEAEGQELDSSEQAAPRRICLMEKFGYGVKPKTDARAPVASLLGSEPLPRKKTGMMELKVGHNDLKERLARR